MLVSAFCARKIFSLKERNRLEIVLITSFYYTTESKTYQLFLLALNKLKTPFGETPWLTGRHATPLVTMFFVPQVLRTICLNHNNSQKGCGRFYLKVMAGWLAKWRNYLLRDLNSFGDKWACQQPNALSIRL